MLLVAALLDATSWTQACMPHLASLPRTSNASVQPQTVGECMLQALEAWHQARTHQSSIVSDIFEGQLQSTLTCDTCGTRSHSFEVFQDLSLPLPHTSPGNLSIQAGPCSSLKS